MARADGSDLVGDQLAGNQSTPNPQAKPAPKARPARKATGSGAGRSASGRSPSRPASTSSSGSSSTSGTGTGAAAGTQPVRLPRLPASVAAVSETGAQFVLAFFLWGWVGLPLIKGGPAAVKQTLRAKFFNKDQNGAPLP